MNMVTTDDDGYVMSDVHEVRSETACFFLVFLPERSGGIDLEHKWVVEPTGSKDLLVGWIWFSDIDMVTTNRSFETPENWYRDYRVISQTVDIPEGTAYNEGLSAPVLSGDEPFWLWTEGTENGGKLVIDMDLKWEPKDARKTLVLMNKDGSEGVSVDISYGTRLPLLLKVPLPLMTGGILLIVLGAVLLIWARKK
ncbi:MAG: hypothetical protein MUC62_04015 [Candidatus Thermoplasmatota archaeon]|jgi:hypothetical protein|nr:hypothetical protein [Candidatus Thermoplasmatota archaeon]